MNENLKKFYDRLVKAEWVENVRHAPTKQAGESELETRFIKSDNLSEYGGYKIVAFAKLYSELLSAAPGPIPNDELILAVVMGTALAKQTGLSLFG